VERCFAPRDTARAAGECLLALLKKSRSATPIDRDNAGEREGGGREKGERQGRESIRASPFTAGATCLRVCLSRHKNHPLSTATIPRGDEAERGRRAGEGGGRRRASRLSRVPAFPAPSSAFQFQWQIK